jgi:hypothetical protein
MHDSQLSNKEYYYRLFKNIRLALTGIIGNPAIKKPVAE